MTSIEEDNKTFTSELNALIFFEHFKAISFQIAASALTQYPKHRPYLSTNVTNPLSDRYDGVLFCLVSKIILSADKDTLNRSYEFSDKELPEEFKYPWKSTGEENIMERITTEYGVLSNECSSELKNRFSANNVEAAIYAGIAQAAAGLFLKKLNVPHNL